MPAPDPATSARTAPRVLQVSQPVVDGVAVVVGDLTHYLAEDGWDVAVACPPDGYLPDRIHDMGAPVLPWQASRNPGPTAARETKALARLIAEFDPDVVHLHSSKAGLAGRLALRDKRPTVFSPHAWSYYHLTGAMRRAALGWERFAARWTDVLLCGSTEEAAEGAQMGIRGNYRVIANSSSISDPGLTREQARRVVGLDLPPGTPLVACLGRMTHQKGQDVMLRAWPAIRSAVPEARLVLVGQGPDEPTLRDMAGPDVLFGEAPGGHLVAEWMLAADVLAFPSRWETLSLAVLEALQLNRAVVVSDCGGMREAMAGGAGAMVGVGDVKALAEALIPFVRDTDFADRTGVEAGEAYRRVHEHRRVANLAEYADLLRTVARQPN